MVKENFTNIVSENFIKHVNDYMKKNNLTQKEVANRLGIKEYSLSKRLSKKIPLSLDDVDDYSKALGISRYELLDSEDLPDANILLFKELLASLNPKQRAYAIKTLYSFCEFITSKA